MPNSGRASFWFWNVLTQKHAGAIWTEFSRSEIWRTSSDLDSSRPRKIVQSWSTNICPKMESSAGSSIRSLPACSTRWGARPPFRFWWRKVRKCRKDFFRTSKLKLAFRIHCDQMAWLFFIFGHLQLMKNCETEFKICQIRFKLLPNTKLSIENCQKTFNTQPKWWNFAQSGHTGW